MRLDEYDIDEWWDVCRLLVPNMTREQFNAMWAEFQTMKQRRTAN